MLNHKLFLAGSPFVIGILLVCSSQALASGTIICSGAGFPKEAFEDLNGDGCFDTAQDIVGIEGALEAGGIYNGTTNATLVIPKAAKVTCAANATCDWRFDGQAIVSGKILGKNSNIILTTGQAQSFYSSVTITSGGSLALESAMNITLNDTAKITVPGNITLTSVAASVATGEKVKIKSTAGTISINSDGPVTISEQSNIDGAAGISITSNSAGVGALSLGAKVKLFAKKLPTAFISLNAASGECTGLSKIQLNAADSIAINCGGDVIFQERLVVAVNNPAALLEVVSTNGGISVGTVSSFRLKGSAPTVTFQALNDVSLPFVQLQGVNFNYTSSAGDIIISGIARSRGVPDMLHQLEAPVGLCDTSLLKSITPGSFGFVYNCQQINS